MTTGPRLVDHLRAHLPRRSTWIIGVLFVLVLVLYLFVRPEPEPVCDLYVAGTGVDAFVLAQSARSAGLNVQMELAGRSRKGQMKQADRSGASYVAIFGDEGGQVTLKDLQSGEQEELEPTAIVARVLRGRHIG